MRGWYTKPYCIVRSSQCDQVWILNWKRNFLYDTKVDMGFEENGDFCWRGINQHVWTYMVFPP